MLWVHLFKYGLHTIQRLYRNINHTVQAIYSAIPSVYIFMLSKQQHLNQTYQLDRWALIMFQVGKSTKNTTKYGQISISFLTRFSRDRHIKEQKEPRWILALHQLWKDFRPSQMLWRIWPQNYVLLGGRWCRRLIISLDVHW